MTRRLLEIILLVGVLFGLYHARQAYLGREASEAKPSPSREQAASTPHAALAAGDQPSLDTPSPQLAQLDKQTFHGREAEVMHSIYGKFATGDFIAALEFADRASADDLLSGNFHAWLLVQMPVLLTSAGWAQLRLGLCDEATSYLRRAEAMKRSPETAKGLAVCYYKQKNITAAREQFAYYLEKNGDDSQMQVLYTDVLESEGRFDDAVKVLEPLVAALPADERQDETKLHPLVQRLKTMRGRSKESSFQLVETSRNFRLTYRAGDHEDMVTYVLKELEDALDEFIDAFAFHPPRAAIEVALYPQNQFKNVVGGPEWAEGIYDGRLRIPVRAEILKTKRYSSLRTVLRHELVHALFALMSDSRSIPSWFDEGMAQRLSCATPGCPSFQFPTMPGQFLNPQAFSTPYTSYTVVRAAQAYAQSLYLIYTIERKYGDNALRQLVSRITISSDLSSDSLLAPLGYAFADLHRDAADYWSSRRALRPGGAR